MTVFWLVLVLALSGAAVAVMAFAWAVRSGQLDDTDTPARRILFEDEPQFHDHDLGKTRKDFTSGARPGEDCALPPQSGLR
ncbi:MAG: Cytochrome oxidase maturation protein cbb3-type [Deltaproteobacteria bacterium]|nr:Cytochrome oxidase maturation protein cbb3-type [Deltaproteobacteria bacterium]